MNLYRKFRNPLVLSILLFLTFFQNINNQTQSNNSIAVQTPSSSTISDKYYINYSTYLGGDSNDWAGDVYVDSYGFIYVCGYTSSSDFPSTFGNYIQHSKDIFILKLSPDGSEILFSRVIEGNGYDVALEIIVGNNGYIYVSGYTDSTNLPLTNNSYQTEHKGDKDIFVIKLSPDGEILNFTLLGGSGYDVVNDMKVDEEGCVYLIGKPSDGFPTTEGSFNTSFVSPNKFLSKFNENLTQLEYSTFLGSYMYTDVESLFIDEENNAYIVGRTEATGFIYTYSFSPIDPYRNNDDIFVMKFNSKGTDLIYSTLIGGSYAEQYKTSSMDENNNVIVIGWTYSYDFPSTETNTFSSAVYPSDSVPFLFKFHII